MSDKDDVNCYNRADKRLQTWPPLTNLPATAPSSGWMPSWPRVCRPLSKCYPLKVNPKEQRGMKRWRVENEQEKEGMWTLYYELLWWKSFFLKSSRIEGGGGIVIYFQPPIQQTVGLCGQCQWTRPLVEKTEISDELTQVSPMREPSGARELHANNTCLGELFLKVLSGVKLIWRL